MTLRGQKTGRSTQKPNPRGKKKRKIKEGIEKFRKQNNDFYADSTVA